MTWRQSSGVHRLVGGDKAEFSGQTMGARIARHIAEKGANDIRPEFAAMMGGAAARPDGLRCFGRRSARGRGWRRPYGPACCFHI